jgi:hypothetical protein
MGEARTLGFRREPFPPATDIVAKDLTATRIILTLYFTIFLNQLDILSPYTPNGTSRSVPR